MRTYSPDMLIDAHIHLLAHKEHIQSHDSIYIHTDIHTDCFISHSSLTSTDTQRGTLKTKDGHTVIH